MNFDWSRCHHFEYWSISFNGKEAQALIDLPLEGGQVGDLKIEHIRHNYIGFTNWFRNRDKEPTVMRAGSQYLKMFRAKIISALARAMKSGDKCGSATMNFESEDGYQSFLNELTINVKLQKGEKVRVC